MRKGLANYLKDVIFWLTEENTVVTTQGSRCTGRLKQPREDELDQSLLGKEKRLKVDQMTTVVCRNPENILCA